MGNLERLFRYLTWEIIMQWKAGKAIKKMGGDFTHVDTLKGMSLDGLVWATVPHPCAFKNLHTNLISFYYDSVLPWFGRSDICGV